MRISFYFVLAMFVLLVGCSSIYTRVAQDGSALTSINTNLDVIEYRKEGNLVIISLGKIINPVEKPGVLPEGEPSVTKPEDTEGAKNPSTQEKPQL